MTLYIYNKITDYQDTRNYTPEHLITKEISRDRFQELYIRIRLIGKDVIRPYTKVGLSDFRG